MGYFILSLLICIVIIGFIIVTFYRRSEYFLDIGLVWIVLFWNALLFTLIVYSNYKEHLLDTFFLILIGIFTGLPLLLTLLTKFFFLFNKYRKEKSASNSLYHCIVKSIVKPIVWMFVLFQLFLLTSGYMAYSKANEAKVWELEQKNVFDFYSPFVKRIDMAGLGRWSYYRSRYVWDFEE